MNFWFANSMALSRPLSHAFSAIQYIAVSVNSSFNRTFYVVHRSLLTLPLLSLSAGMLNKIANKISRANETEECSKNLEF